AAEADAGARLLADAESLDVINEISWPYADAPGLVAARLGIAPARRVYHPVGGQTPMLAIHEAALRIAAGESRIALVCGAEAEHSVRRAGREGRTLHWSPRLADFQPVRGANYQRDIARRLEAATPTNVYPFYEAATRAAWGQSFTEAQAEYATIWAANARIAATREAAWIKSAPSPEAILNADASNRPIAWPYTKLMVANPTVNQGAGVIVTSLAAARAAGVPEDRCIFIHGGAASDEPRDYLDRASYAEAPAMAAVLAAAQRLAPEGFRAVELYSCFPVVPKLARRALGLAADAPLSVAGGLTFFGAPLNNYMTHAAVAMVERLRATGGTGLLFGQGEYVTKHHALVLGPEPAPAPLDTGYRLPEAGGSTAPVPPFAADHDGPATLETATVLFDRDGAPRHGVVIARTPSGARTMARAVGADIAPLMDPSIEPVGARGRVRPGADGLPEWRHG
ncbi:MAG: acetyl-CoA acetyltransferase, partial [Alphaproteobacteria bacterium]|nr:acetyl-CoA acetyltransferase [Alphaproteobacteria bacterium]